MITRVKTSVVLPVIVVSQFMATSLWFAGNAVAVDLQVEFNLGEGAIASITSAVQFGFIAGTFIFALLTITDRYSPSRIFFVCALVGSALNMGMLFASNFSEIVLLRFAIGACLAGVYPVGMKIAADHNEKGLGKALGYLVGALVLGTALPHLFKSLTSGLPWKNVIIATSALATAASLLILLFIPDGPFRRKSTRIQVSAFVSVFRNNSFRRAAYGYFGHMWELYTFWAFVPLILGVYLMENTSLQYDISLLSFITIGIGGIACIAGGYASIFFGSSKVARFALFISGICCLLSPLFYSFPFGFFIFLMLLWGMAVVADSPQFSTIVAAYAPKEMTGTALTIVNSIGFALTIVSIQFCSLILSFLPIKYIGLVLAVGPAFGLISILYRHKARRQLVNTPAT